MVVRNAILAATNNALAVGWMVNYIAKTKWRT